MILTPWLPGDTHPVRQGVYQRDFGRERKYAYWNGKQWLWGADTPEKAVETLGFSSVQLQFSAVVWRGLMEESDDPTI
jgi:hypothetical protein